MADSCLLVKKLKAKKQHKSFSEINVTVPEKDTTCYFIRSIQTAFGSKERSSIRPIQKALLSDS
jgi:hypothetical protein